VKAAEQEQVGERAGVGQRKREGRKGVFNDKTNLI